MEDDPFLKTEFSTTSSEITDVLYNESQYPATGGLEWSDVRMTVFNSREGAEKKVLKGMSGRVEKGQLLGILGGSGAGKSTFLNCLAGRLSSTESMFASKESWLAQNVPLSSIEVSGKIAYDKKTLNLGSKSESLKGLAAYVMQSDILCSVHTPEEAIGFSARLRLDKDMSEEEKNERVDRVIKSLKIEKCKDTLIGDDSIRGVSGGEKKRTSVAVELVTDPSIIFLDEPTSGLDSFTSIKTVELLKELTIQGDKIVVCTLHQPSPEVLWTLDLVLIVCEGHTVFFGPPSQLTDYMAQMDFFCAEHQSPSDFALGSVQENPDYFIEQWQKREKSILAARPMQFEEYEMMKEDDNSNLLQTASLHTQCWELVKREVIIFQRDPRPSRLRLAQTIVFAIIVGALYWNIPDNQNGLRDRWGFLFFVVINNTFLGAMASMVTFPDQRLLLERERANNVYSTSVFFIVKTIFQILEAMLFTMVSCLILYWTVGVNSAFFQEFYLLLALMVNSGGSMGVLLGCFANNASEAITLMPMVLTPQMLFSDYMVSVEQIPAFLRWVRWVIIFYYAIDAFAILEFRDQDFKLDEGQGFSTGEQYLDSLGIDKKNLGRDFIMVITLSILFRVMAWVVLVLKLGW